MDQPNIEEARKTFAFRVALAYERTWHGFGFDRSQYTWERAAELGARMAQVAFPDVSAPIEITLKLDPGPVQEVIRQFRQEFDDGVAGD